MNRRDAVVALLALGAAPLAAVAQQQAKIFRIGFLAAGGRPESFDSSQYAGFIRGMRERGYTEGRNYLVEWRFAEGRYERFPELAEELVRLKVDVIVVGAGVVVPAAKRATDTIPIVMGSSANPERLGYVVSLARPGGNVTGLSSMVESYEKILELLKSIVPGLSRVAVLLNTDAPKQASIRLETLQASAQKLGTTILPVLVRSPEEIDSGFDLMKRERAQGIIVSADALFVKQRLQITRLALTNKLPSIYANGEYVEAGGLMSYGQPLYEYYRQAAAYVDKILKGAKPADLPIEQPTKFELLINLNTAKALGLRIPSELLLRADRVIE
jgi:putative ABC transport system substrate-binding protein